MLYGYDRKEGVGSGHDMAISRNIAVLFTSDLLQYFIKSYICFYFTFGWGIFDYELLKPWVWVISRHFFDFMICALAS